MHTWFCVCVGPCHTVMFRTYFFHYSLWQFVYFRVWLLLVGKKNNSWGFWEHLGAWFLYGHIEWIKIRSLTSGIVNSRLWIKLTALRSFPSCLYREAICLQCFSAHTLHEWAWPCVHMDVTTFTWFAQNCNITGSLVELHGSAMHVALSLGEIPSLQCCTLKSLLYLLY